MILRNHSASLRRGATGQQSQASPATSEPKPLAALLVGATAVGKTEIALELAELLNGEIISVDSRLFYRGMDIGTAKPTREERARAPHHLIDIADPDETIGLAEFQRLAHEAVAGVLARARLPLLVGGTGQFIRALTGGWRPPGVKPNEALRNELQRLTDERGKPWLHERLQMLDPEAADMIDSRNARRAVRAMEVILSSGRRFSEQRRHGEAACRMLTIGLRRPRAELYARIDARIDSMLNRGLLEETRTLLHRGYPAQLPALSAIGYAQCVRVIEGELDIEKARAEIRSATRAFVRHQSNWFKDSDPDISWFEAGQAGVAAAIGSFIKGALLK